MAYDEGLAQTLREDLQGRGGLSERKMFGGLCLLLHGNMLCGLYRDGGMFRVGKESMDAALALPGVTPMQFTGRPMKGIVEADAAAFVDDDRRCKLLDMALAFVTTLPPK